MSTPRLAGTITALLTAIACFVILKAGGGDGHINPIERSAGGAHANGGENLDPDAAFAIPSFTPGEDSKAQVKKALSNLKSLSNSEEPAKGRGTSQRRNYRQLNLFPHREFLADSTIIYNDETWFDDEQQEIKANRCGSISHEKINGFWYMVGSDSGVTWDYGGDIWLYKSKTLGSNSWQKVKRIKDYEEGGGTTSSSCAINQKSSDIIIIYCRKKVFKSEDGPEGTYTQLSDLNIPSSHPGQGEMKVGGSSTFKEANGDMFFVTTRLQKGGDDRQRFAYIYKLNSDWTALNSENDGIEATWLSNRREAPHITKQDGWYYMFFSQTKGWKQSITFYKRASTLKGLSDADLVELEVVMHPSNSDNIKSMASQFCFFQDFGDGKWMFGGRRHPTEAPESFEWEHGEHVMTPANFIDGIPHVYWKYEFDLTTYDFTSTNNFDDHHAFTEENGYGPVPCTDNPGRFWVEKQDRLRSCGWTKKKKTLFRCRQNLEVRAQCPVSCKTFGC